EASAARLGLARLKCELRTQRAHFESVYGGDIRSAVRCGQGALQMAQASGNPELVAAARFALGQAHWLTGEYPLGIDDLAADAEPCLDGRRIRRTATGGTLAVEALAILGGCLGLTGQFEPALRHGQAAVAVAGETALPVDAIVAGYHLARTQLAQGDAE